MLRFLINAFFFMTPFINEALPFDKSLNLTRQEQFQDNNIITKVLCPQWFFFLKLPRLLQMLTSTLSLFCRISLCSPAWPQSYIPPLSQFHKCWVCRHVPLYAAIWVLLSLWNITILYLSLWAIFHYIPKCYDNNQKHQLSYFH